ncbi:hypothetical protein Nepgr_012147 [Nepenthes gracilis]|uniref:Uncharacterized protein n=1 Tax=Nepenthes gracilis TaxID=150966 RepID=A0AAD3XN13_NEPGR|nr:hypothetical protein Nepgr_012147 [Nepenthes gracilis]
MFLRPPFISFQTPATASLAAFSFYLSLYDDKLPFVISSQPTTRRRRRIREAWSITAVERESQFEVDADKARQALDELDQQLESLSKKQVPSPKIRASSLSSSLRDQMEEEIPDFSGSFLTYTAYALFAFTIFYNIFFLLLLMHEFFSGNSQQNNLRNYLQGEAYRHLVKFDHRAMRLSE